MKKKNSKGVITVFLVLILVPMLLVTSVFVDASRFKLANSLATSVNDLTLNSAVTKYDPDLKDLYGLFASVKNVNEFYKELSGYYKTIISQSGLPDEEAKTLSEAMIYALKNNNGEESLANFFKMDIIDDVTVEPLDGGNLANPVILEQQIVDFMKYRTPINTGLSFITALQSFSTINDQKKVIEKKNDYYNAVSSVNKLLQKSWESIYDYMCGDFWTEGSYNYKKYKPDNYNNGIVGNYIASLTGEKGAFTNFKKQYHDDTILFFKDISSKTYYYSFKYFSNIKTETNEKVNKPSVSEINNAKNKFYECYGKCKGYANNDGSYSLEIEYQNGYYMPQIWLQNNYSDKYGNIYKAYEDLAGAYIYYKKLENGVNSLDDKEENKEELKSALTNDVDICFNGVKDEVLSLQRRLKQYYDEYYSKFNDSSNKIESHVSSIRNQISDISNDLNKASELLEDAIKSLKKAKKACDEDLPDAKNKWRESITKNIEDTTIGKENLAEIEGLHDEYINKDVIDSFIDYLDSLKEKIDNLKKQVDGYEYCGTNLKDIKNRNSFAEALLKDYKKAYKSDKTSVGLFKEEDIKNQAENFFGKDGNCKFKAGKKGEVDVGWMESTNPNLASEQAKTYALFNYLYSQFGRNVVNDSGKTKQTKDKSKQGNTDFNSIKNNAKKVDQGTTDLSPSQVVLNEEDILTSEAFNGVTVGESDTDGTLKNAKLPKSGKLFAGLASMATGFRDNLYVVDYVMSMFSYSTIELEYKDKNKDQNNNENEKENTEEIKTLTQKAINADNNVLYPSEVEYIVFGNKTASKNVTTTCASIYATRLLFNIIYAMTSSELSAEALPIAAAISAATLGVLPVTLVKIAILLACAAIESGIDLALLRKGESVNLYKTQETWATSFSSAGKKIVEKVVSKTVEVASENLVEFLDSKIDQLSDNLSEVEDYLGNYFDKRIDDTVYGITDILINSYKEAEQVVFMKYGDLSDTNAINEIRIELKESIEEWSKDDSEIIRLVKSQVANKMNGYLDTFISDMETISISPSEQIETLMENLTTKIKMNVKNSMEEVESYIEDSKQEFVTGIKETISSGADKLKGKINSSISQYFGGSQSENGDMNNSVESLLSFRYSDYLRFFAMCSIYTNEENFILRTGTLIQQNMRKSKKDFNLDKANVYIKVKTTVKVKPLLIDLKLFDRMINVKDDGSWGKYTFENVKGY